MGRWLASLAIVGLLGIALFLPTLPGLRQGIEPGKVRADAPDALAAVGQRLPDFELADAEGAPVRLADLRGKRVLLTFERSVDW